jgi:hypothetical protein
MKRWLVIVNDQYYPSAGTRDWRGCFKTRPEAEAYAATIERDGNSVEIVDLFQWIDPDKDFWDWK